MRMAEVTLERCLGLEDLLALVDLAESFSSEIYLHKGGVHVNVKSLLGLACVPLRRGERFTLVLHGTDEEEALGKLVRFFSEADPPR
ncbi:MAG: HPr family phosphocarrier protein [Brockia lithotrophica]|nr:HPr family phosphocarrier protein [Brockia lithotrophica]